MSFLFELAGGLAELVDWCRAVFSAWHYLLSASYRRKVHEGWRFETRFYVAWDILCGLAGFTFTLLFGYLLVAVLVGFDWLPRLVFR
jgi:hypothetical protein